MAKMLKDFHVDEYNLYNLMKYAKKLVFVKSHGILGLSTYFNPKWFECDII